MTHAETTHLAALEAFAEELRAQPFMKTKEQQTAFDQPLIGREGDGPLFWILPPWRFGLSFNR